MHCPSIYLAGSADEVDYRKEVKKELGDFFDLLDPMEYSPRSKYLPAQIIERDKELIRRSDIFLAYIEKPTFGTIMEIMYAWFREIPIYVITTNPEFRDDMWLKEHTNRFFDSVKDVKAHLTK